MMWLLYQFPAAIKNMKEWLSRLYITMGTAIDTKFATLIAQAQSSGTSTAGNVRQEFADIKKDSLGQPVGEVQILSKSGAAVSFNIATETQIIAIGVVGAAGVNITSNGQQYLSTSDDNATPFALMVAGANITPTLYYKILEVNGVIQGSTIAASGTATVTVIWWQEFDRAMRVV